jgi:hypothetical protein
MKKGDSTEEEDPREAPHDPLKLSVAGGRSFAKGATDRTLFGERKRVWEEGNSRGFKYPRICAGPNIVRESGVDLRFSKK